MCQGPTFTLVGCGWGTGSRPPPRSALACLNASPGKSSSEKHKGRSSRSRLPSRTTPLKLQACSRHNKHANLVYAVVAQHNRTGWLGVDLLSDKVDRKHMQCIYVCFDVLTEVVDML